MATPFGRGRFGFQAAQQRRRLAQQRLQRLQAPALQQPWRPLAALAPRNPWISLWAAALRQGIAVQRGLAEMRVAELKAIEGALAQFAGGRPMPPLGAGLWGFRPWGQGLASDVASPYTATATSSDVSTTPAPPVDTTTTPAPAPVETEPMPQPTGPKPSTRILYRVFEQLDEKSPDDERYFTEHGLPRASVVNARLEDLGHGPADGVARVTAADIEVAWPRFQREEAYERHEHEGEEGEKGEKPDHDDFAACFKSLGTKDLTQQGIPEVDSVKRYMRKHGFDVSSINADRVRSEYRRFTEDQEEEHKGKHGRRSHGRESEEDEEKEREHRKP